MAQKARPPAPANHWEAYEHGECTLLIVSPQTAENPFGLEPYMIGEIYCPHIHHYPYLQISVCNGRDIAVLGCGPAIQIIG